MYRVYGQFCKSIAKHLFLRKMGIKTFIFVDCETTGLPCFQYNRTKITELSFTVVESSHISLGVYPRVQSKLSQSFNPCKLIDPVATEITGLSNDLLEYQPVFNFKTVELIKSFLNVFEKPQCLVAHNGFNFDYPILRAEILKSNNFLPDDLLCVDTLQMFKQLHNENESIQAITNDSGMECIGRNSGDIGKFVGSSEVQKINETTPKKPKIKKFKTEKMDNLYYNPDNKDGAHVSCSQDGARAKKKLVFPISFKLEECYKRFTNKEPQNAHRAEVDVDMLVECAATLGQKFVDISNETCKLFCNIPPMSIGKKIGT